MDNSIAQKSAPSYRRTFVACMIGIANQAVVASITALLFVSFMDIYGFEVWQLGVLVGVNFASQLVADIILTLYLDKLSYRALTIVAQSLASGGLMLFAVLPMLPVVAASSMRVYAVMIVSTVIFAFSGGMMEVTVSPIIDAIPDSKSKSGIMSLMHSFYAWGMVAAVIITALYILIAGAANWHYIVIALSIVPLVNIFCFATCPIERRGVEVSGEKENKKKTLFSPYMLFALLAIFTGGATETAMTQYVSTFTTVALGFSKATSDLVGMCLFAAMMGVMRTLYGFMGDKLNMNAVLVVGSFASMVLYLVVGLVPFAPVALVACVLCGLSVALLWPGVLVVTGRRFPTSGGWIFAVLAISGDLGAGIIPTCVGFIADSVGLKTAFVISSVIPLVCFVCNVLLYKSDKKANSLMIRR